MKVSRRIVIVACLFLLVCLLFAYLISKQRDGTEYQPNKVPKNIVYSECSYSNCKNDAYFLDATSFFTLDQWLSAVFSQGTDKVIFDGTEIKVYPNTKQQDAIKGYSESELQKKYTRNNTSTTPVKATQTFTLTERISNKLKSLHTKQELEDELLKDKDLKVLYTLAVNYYETTTNYIEKFWSDVDTNTQNVSRQNISEQNVSRQNISEQNVSKKKPKWRDVNRSMKNTCGNDGRVYKDNNGMWTFECYSR